MPLHCFVCSHFCVNAADIPLGKKKRRQLLWKLLGSLDTTHEKQVHQIARAFNAITYANQYHHLQLLSSRHQLLGKNSFWLPYDLGGTK